MKHALLAILLAGAALAQTFEVASVRPSSADGGGAVRNWGKDTGNVVLRRIPLSALIREAYGLHTFQLSGPDWLAEESYDILATAPAGAPKTDILRMLQALLVDRFQMSTHRETEERSVYAMVVREGGPKPAADTSEKPGEDVALERDSSGNQVVRILNDPTLGPYRMTPGKTGFHYEFEGITMAGLERFLNQGYVDRPLFDRTGLNGAYQITIDFPFPASVTGNSDPPGYSVEESLQKAGLQLMRTRGPVETLVIDRISKTPTEN